MLSPKFTEFQSGSRRGGMTLPKDSDVLTDHTAVRTERGECPRCLLTLYKGTDRGYRQGEKRDRVFVSPLYYDKAGSRLRPKHKAMSKFFIFECVISDI